MKILIIDIIAPLSAEILTYGYTVLRFLRIFALTLIESDVVDCCQDGEES